MVPCLWQSPQRLLSLLDVQQVSETSPQSRTKLVSTTSPQLMETSRRRLRDLLETGKSLNKSNIFEFPASRRRGDVSAISGHSSRHQDRLQQSPRTKLVSEICWRLEKVFKNRTSLNFPRLPGDPASLHETSETSPQPVDAGVATRSLPSLQANTIGP